ncbi:hypothetical protein [Phenylobacterium sp.]|jgi:hypothetical protein|uniref:hypothetical protein n=1 Tax=Phenylobacterium sp. TaxID=1871053 RepID=UPI002F429C9F
MANDYTLSYLAGGFAPVWTRVLALESDEAAIETARNLLEIEAGRTEARPLTLLVGLGAEGSHNRWLGAWSWDPKERWQPA